MPSSQATPAQTTRTRRAPERAGDSSQGEVARLLGVTERQVRNLEGEGLPRHADGSYTAAACVGWYVRFKADEAVRRSAPSGDRSLQDLQKEELEVRIARERLRFENERGALVAKDAYRDELTAILSVVMAELNSIEGQWSTKLVHLDTLAGARRALRPLVTELRTRLRNAAGRAALSVEADERDEAA